MVLVSKSADLVLVLVLHSWFRSHSWPWESTADPGVVHVPF